jgi:NAD-dependent dihydropyrimidine dehydrogenase PreA subunit
LGGWYNCGVISNHKKGETKMAHKIAADKCVACGCCKDACPAEAISEGTPYVIDADKCVDCGACAATCPNEAIAPA